MKASVSREKRIGVRLEVDSAFLLKKFAKYNKKVLTLKS